MNSFSVCMSVYRNDKPEDFPLALQSITTKQTLKPSEVVLVIDGPVMNEINKVISEVTSAIQKLMRENGLISWP